MDELALLLAFLAVVLAIVAVQTAGSAHRALREVERQLRALGRTPRETSSRGEEQPIRESPVEAPEVPELAEPAPTMPEILAAAARQVERPPAAGPRAERTPGKNLEERLGASLPIWFGAIALTLAGVFLVRHFAERGLLGPAARVGIAVGFGFASLGVAWRMRARWATIAQGVAGAGIAVLFGATYAATALYGFLTPLLGVVAQGVVTALAVLASLRFGPFVALLGLVGGFAMPALIGAERIATPVMFGYLGLLQVGLSAFGRRRDWWWLPVLGAFAAFVWVFAWAGLRGEGHAVLSGFALFAGAIAIAATRGVRATVDDGMPSVATLVPWLVCAAALGVLLQDLAATAFAAEQWLWLSGLCVGALFLAARDRTLGGLPWLAAVVVGTWLLASAELRVDGVRLVDAHRDAAILGYALLFTFGAHLAGRLGAASRALLAWLPPFAIAVASRALVMGTTGWLGASLPGLAAAIAMAALAAWTDFREPEDARIQRASGLWSAAVVALFCALYESVGVDHRAAALAPLPLSLAVVAAWRRLEPLAVVTLGLTVLVGIVLVADQVLRGAPVEGVLGSPPSIAFGAAAVATFAVSRILYRSSATSAVARVHQTLAIAFAATEIAVWCVRSFEESHIERPEFLLSATLTVAWLALGRVLFRTAPRWAIGGGERPGSHVTVLGLAVLVAGCGMGANPLTARSAVGSWPILNGVLLAFGAGGALALVAALDWRAVGAARRAAIAGWIAFLAGFALVTLEVRQAFQGTILVGDVPDRAEWYTYSAAWLVYGAVLLAVGVVRGQRPLRYASLLVVLSAVLKVFLFDASNLDGLWRVLSFFGLGVSLIALAWVYQRFVVRRSR